MIEPWVYPALTAVAVLTGFIDAVAGGGGLIMLPALLFAGASPIQALATNKLQSMFGTAVGDAKLCAGGPRRTGATTSWRCCWSSSARPLAFCWCRRSMPSCSA